MDAGRESIDNSNDCVPCIFGTSFSKKTAFWGPKNFFACGAPKGACGAGGAKTPTLHTSTYGTPLSGGAGPNPVFRASMSGVTDVICA